MKLIATFIAGLIVGLCAPVSASDDGYVTRQLDNVVNWMNKTTEVVQTMVLQIGELQKQTSLALTAIEALAGDGSKVDKRVGELERRYSRIEAQLKQPRPIVITGDKI